MGWPNVDFGCENLLYEENECCKCFLLGYQFYCGSPECLEAKKNENNKMDDKKIYHIDVEVEQCLEE